MVIDKIFDRMSGSEYFPTEFYHYAMAESEIFDGMFDELTRAMDFGTEDDVRRELKKYIAGQGVTPFNVEVCKFIDGVSWLSPSCEMLDKISMFERENGFFGTVIWCDDDLKNSLENRDIESTPENVEKLKNFLLNSNNSLNDYLISIGLDFIDDTITCIFPADN